MTGTEIGGIVSYRWDGQTYSLDAQGYGSAKAVGVDLDPADPSNAVIDNTFPRVVEGTLVAVPAAAGVALLVVGLTRRRRWERRQVRIAPKTGQVLDQEFVTRHLRELRHGDRAATRAWPGQPRPVPWPAPRRCAGAGWWPRRARTRPAWRR